MKTWITRITQMSLAAFVAVSLGIGVTQLRATAVTVDHCHPSTFGHCESQTECAQICATVDADDHNCLSNCCWCFFE